MNRHKKSPSRLCIGLLFVFFALAFLLPAVKEGGDARLWILSVSVPGVLLLIGIPFISRLLSLDRILSVIALALCASGILSLAPEVPDESFSQGFLCACALVLMIFGSFSMRFLRPGLMTSLIFGGLALGLCAVPILVSPASSVHVSDLGLPMLLIAFVSLLSMRNQIPAMLLALAGMALLLAQGCPVTAVIWGITFGLVFWAYSGHPAILAAGIAVSCILVSASGFLFPGLSNVGQPHSLYRDMDIGLFGPSSFGTSLIPEGSSSDFLFPLIVGRYGWIVSACLILLYPAIVIRGSSVARAARTRFHGLVAMGAVLLITLHAAAALLSDAGIISVQQVVLPGLSRDFSATGAFLFLIGILGGVSVRNQADLEEDVHLAMLAG